MSNISCLKCKYDGVISYCKTKIYYNTLNDYYKLQTELFFHLDFCDLNSNCTLFDSLKETTNKIKK